MLMQAIFGNDLMTDSAVEQGVSRGGGWPRRQADDKQIDRRDAERISAGRRGAP
jgi:hypothetical protein